jgi:hypothetical protein
MKQFSFSALLLFIVLVTGSCKKIPVINQINSSISFKFDGVSKEAKGDKNVFAIYAKEINIVQIVGNLDATGDDHQIMFMINNFHGLGEYTAEEDLVLMYNTPELNASVLGTEGKIKITEYTEGKSIKGEFQFKGELAILPNGPDDGSAVKIISEGKFQAKVTEHSGPIELPE